MIFAQIGMTNIEIFLNKSLSNIINQNQNVSHINIAKDDEVI